MDDAVRVDMARLREHVSIAEEERRLASALCSHLSRAKSYSPPEYAGRYDELLSRADALENHFSSAVVMLDDLRCIFERCGKEISDILQDAMKEAEKAK